MTLQAAGPSHSRPRRTALIAVIAGALTLTACGGGDGTSGDAPTSFAKGQADTPAAKGPLDSYTWYGDYRAPYSLDPVKNADYPEQTVLPNICESLLRVRSDYTLEPALASAWKQPDPRTLVFTLRQGVKFADGTPMTAADVVYSLERNRKPAITSSYSSLYANVASITAGGTSSAPTVTVKFREPNAVFVNVMATLGGSVMSRAHAESKGAALGTPAAGVLCTGPYRVTSFDGAGDLVLERNDHYWDAKAVRSKKVTFVFPTGAQALSNAIAGKSVDGGFNIPSQLVPTLAKAAGGKLWTGAAGSSPQNLDLVISDLKGGPLADARLRQALSGAIDREGIARSVFSSAADPLYAVAGPGTWGYEREQYQKAYDALTVKTDPVQGKKLVTEAGATGRKLKLAYPTGIDMYASVATTLQQAAKKIGLDMEIVGLPLAQYGEMFIDPAARKPYDAFLTMNYIQITEPAFLYGFIATPDGPQNYGGYDNPQVAEKITRAFGTTDDKARAGLLIEAQAQLGKDLPWIPIVAPRATVYLSDRVAGVPLTFAYMGRPWAGSVGAP
ncbi:ABC transporter substrate-binding protein [Streptomyces albipurpureus]|uniref:ABC transporter substrate-binding protein n=1 Tax=Streptomyces albipurpureus TaxID=2897419 RepID=A0ABT0UPS0_9ACTN|nr:ABC transporter substrate-binding protein [Streptomyces sp. CWNU-1]MCM2389246.1 ABC transporter substrate-binding protein [Streptomyces sp. CWNU-1]